MDTTALQRALIALGYPLPKFGADGGFGGETRSTVSMLARSARCCAARCTCRITLVKRCASGAKPSIPNRIGPRPSPGDRRGLRHSPVSNKLVELGRADADLARSLLPRHSAGKVRDRVGLGRHEFADFCLEKKRGLSAPSSTS